MNATTESTNYRWPLFVLLFLCFAGAILGDSTTEALLLSHYGPGIVPRMYLVNALFLAIFSSFFITAVDRVDRGVFFAWVCTTHAGVLLLLRLAFSFNAYVLYLPLFSYAYITKILIFSLFWTLVNDLIDSRKAGTDFPFIAAGGTLGAIIVSFSIPWILKIIDAKNLLLVWAGLVLAIVAVFLPLRARFGLAFKPNRDRPRLKRNRLASMVDDLRMVRREPLLLNMSVFYLIMFFLLLNQHFVFYQNLRGRLSNANELAAFLGYFNGISMAITFLLQLTCSGYLLRKIGATRAMFLLPAVLCAVFGVLAIMGWNGALLRSVAVTVVGDSIFWGVVLGMGARIAFFDSFFSPNFQIFFSSLPANIRGRGKFTIEGIVKPGAMVCASLWLMFAPRYVPFTVWMLLLVVLAAALIVQTFRIKQHYTDSLVSYLTGIQGKQSDTVKGFAASGNDPAFVRMLETALGEEESDTRSYIIGILAEINSDETIGILVRNLGAGSVRTRSMILSALKGNTRPGLCAPLLRQLMDDDPRLVANAIDALSVFAADPAVSTRLMEYVFHANNRIRANTIVALWPSVDGVSRDSLRRALVQMMKSEDEAAYASALYAVSRIGTEALMTELDLFFESHRERILANRSLLRQFLAACSRITSFGSTRLLFQICDSCSRKQRGDIATALARQIREGLPVDELVRKLDTLGRVPRSIVLRALYLNKWTPGKADEVQLHKCAMDEVNAAYLDLGNIRVLREHDGSERNFLLCHAVFEECVQPRLENVIYISSIADKSGQIRRIMHRLRHDNHHVRARAWEVLDNAGDVRINRQLLDLLECAAVTQPLDRQAGHSGAVQPDPLQALATYRMSANTWIRECAQYALKGEPNIG